MIYDFAVIGGGPAGAVAARELSRKGFNGVLIDHPKPKYRQVGESLPPAAVPLLKNLELESVVTETDCLPYSGNVSSWGSDELVAIDFFRDPNGLGWHLNRTQFDEALRQCAVYSGSDRRTGKVSSIERGKDGFTVTVEEHPIQAKMLVEATGRACKVARAMGVNPLADDTLMAIYAWTPQVEDDVAQMTLVEASENGWWYSSRVPDGTRVTAFHTDADKVGLLVRSRKAWQKELEKTKHVKAVVKTGRRLSTICTPAWGGRLESFGGEGWIAVGDAAMTFDPLSSQGILNAIYTGAKAAEALERLWRRDPEWLSDYSERLVSIRAAYLRNHRNMYTMEWRWAENAFWAARGNTAEAASFNVSPHPARA